MPNIKKVNLKKVRDLSSDSSGIQFFTVPGYNQPFEIRVLPPVDNMEDYYVTHHAHYNGLGSNRSGFLVGDRNRAITCLAKHKDTDCPVCDLVAVAKEEDDTDVARGLWASKRHYINIIDVTSGQVMIWSAPTTVINQINAILRGRFGDITDPNTGRNIEVVRTGNPKNISSITYATQCLDKSKIKIKDWENSMTDCSTLVKIFPQEEVAQILYDNLNPLGVIPKYYWGSVSGLTLSGTSTKTTKRRIAKRKATKTRK